MKLNDHEHAVTVRRPVKIRNATMKTVYLHTVMENGGGGRDIEPGETVTVAATNAHSYIHFEGTGFEPADDEAVEVIEALADYNRRRAVAHIAYDPGTGLSTFRCMACRSWLARWRPDGTIVAHSKNCGPMIVDGYFRALNEPQAATWRPNSGFACKACFRQIRDERPPMR